jgi:hypothetical protein
MNLNPNKHRVQNKYMTKQIIKSNSTKQVEDNNINININVKENIIQSNASTVIPSNMIHKYISQLVKSEIDLTNGNLNNSIELLLKGAFYYPHLICNEKDTTFFNNIVKELEEADEFKIVEWSKHCKIDNPRFSKTFNEIIEKISKIFNVTVCETRLNYYKDKNDWKPLHHDSHAYGNGIREDFTIGISLGEPRELIFMHESSGNKFKFPQRNGDIFAFDKYVNKDFLHGITKSLRTVGPRISLVAWCKRNT